MTSFSANEHFENRLGTCRSRFLRPPLENAPVSSIRFSKHQIDGVKNMTLVLVQKPTTRWPWRSSFSDTRWRTTNQRDLTKTARRSNTTANYESPAAFHSTNDSSSYFTGSDASIITNTADEREPFRICSRCRLTVFFFVLSGRVSIDRRL